jgi:uncharacterized protein (DUF58 family)
MQMEKRFPSQPAGYLFSRFGVLTMLAALLLAAWYGQVVIVVLLGLVLSAAGLAKLWSRLSLVSVHCQRQLSEQRAFPGEYVELKLRVVNRKLLPLPWIQVEDEIPIGFAPDVSLPPGNKPGFGLLSQAAALLWYTGVSWRHRLYCNKRGYYTLGPITVTSGDIFGFYPRSITEPLIDHIIVYPRIFPIAQLGIPSLYPLGDTSAERRIFEDPSRVIGVRDYTPHDSLRRIHWKATARHQNLQVKVFEPTTTLKVELFLAVDSFEYDGVRKEKDFELGISTAASIANYVTEQRSPVGLLVNTRLADSGQPVRILPGTGTNQLVSILEALAKVTPHSSIPFEEFLQGERRGLPWGTTLIFILSIPSKSLTGRFADLRESGHKLLVLQVGNQEGGNFDYAGIWHNVRAPGDLMEISSKETK